MLGHGTRVLGAVALLAGLSTVLWSNLQAGNRAARSGTVRIGLIASLFSDVPEPIVMAMMQPFGALMEAQTGVSGELAPCGDADNLGQQLMDDKVQLGIFHGIEFAGHGRSIPRYVRWCSPSTVRQRQGTRSNRWSPGRSRRSEPRQSHRTS